MIVAVVVTLLLLAMVALVGGALLLSRPPKNRSSGDLALHALGDGVYMYRGFFSNSAVLVLDDGVVVVDTQVAPIGAKRLRAEIAKITEKPVRFVVNTHYHGDHTGGNGLFPEAEIVATEETARYVVERDEERVEYAHTFGLEFQEVHATGKPTRTFEGETTLTIGDDEVHVLQLGRVETPDACVVHWPKRRVVACGDGVATHDYPYLGVPFMDEGLRDDGSWIGYLRAIRDLKPRVLIPGHGPPLVGESVIAARLDLLIALFTDLMASVKDELAKKTPLPELVERVDAKLAHYRARSDLAEHTVSQRFAIYRCINNLLPERKGHGWWRDLRPSVIARADAADTERALAELSGPGISERALAIAARNRPLAISVLETHLLADPNDAAAHGVLSDVLFDGMPSARKSGKPFVDCMEYVAASSKAAKAALAIDDGEPRALLNLGAAEVFGAMVLSQCMSSGIDKLERAMRSPILSASQKRKGAFFLGKAHHLEQRDEQSDRWFRALLPAPTRALFPLIRARLRAYP